ncbi:MAG: MBOAT family protein, partial [Sulfurimonadaceae bacterium]|nr:MBOAT family protein [Sulfurimonadaceae bacterium]
FGHVFENIDGKNKTITFLVLAFILILKFKNSMFFRDNFIPNYINLVFTFVLLFTAMSMMSTVSEFLYFNF